MSGTDARRKRRLLRSLEYLLYAAGGILVLVWAGVSVWGTLESRARVADFDASLELPDQQLWSEARKRAYLANLPAAPGAAIGVLRIARLNLESPLFEGVSEFNLNRGVARIDGTAGISEADNLGVAGHRDSFFRPLKDVVVGDRIELETRLETLHYRVVETLVVEPEDVWVLEPSEQKMLTLVTCFPFYFVGSAPERFIVRAVAVGA